jgi:hypothetical protein
MTITNETHEEGYPVFVATYYNEARGQFDRVCVAKEALIHHD